MTIPPDRSDAINPSDSIKPRPAAGQASGAGFESYMQGTGTPSKGPSAPMSTTQSSQFAQTPLANTPSLNTLSSQVATSQDSFASLQNQLNKAKNLQLTRSQQHLIRNKLSDGVSYLRSANKAMGAEVPAAPTPMGNGPIERFLSYLVDGENQLNSARQKLSTLSKSGGQLRPADMMLIQIKLNQAEQEVAYASALLSKAISGVTQILSTQL